MMVIGVFDCDYETSVGLLMEIVYLRSDFCTCVISKPVVLQRNTSKQG